MENSYGENVFGDAFNYGNGPQSQLSSGQVSSLETSRPGSAGGVRSKGKKSVGFSHGSNLVDTKNRPKSIDIPSLALNLSPPTSSPAHGSPSGSGANTPTHSRSPSTDMFPLINRDHLPQVSPEAKDEIRAALALPTPTKPRPAIRRSNSAISTPPGLDVEATSSLLTTQSVRAREAHERAKVLERDERVKSAPSSRRTSPNRQSVLRSPGPRLALNEIPLQDFDDKYDDGSDMEETLVGEERRGRQQDSEAADLVRTHTRGANHVFHHKSTPGFRSGINTPEADEALIGEYVPRPSQYRGGVLGALLKLYNQPGHDKHKRSSSLPRAHVRADSFGTGVSSVASSPGHSPSPSGSTTPVHGKTHGHWFSSASASRRNSHSSVARLIGSSSAAASPAVSGFGEEVAERLKQHQKSQKRPTLSKRTSSSGAVSSFLLGRPRLEEEIRITVHIAETIARHRYLLKLCRALMEYGAPTHRLEEYMRMSARVLEIDAQFLYIPGSMIISFDDESTHTTEVKLVRVNQGLDLGKLRDAHEVYKDVVHDRIGVEEATQRLREIAERTKKHSPYVLVPVYGLASAAVGPFAFEARLIDLPLCFLLGCIVGFLQTVVAPSSELYANVFEISAAVATSFLARAFGSVRHGNLFCFSALAQSSIALILPGYTVLCASLELQSRSIVAGSVRMVYAIIYSLFLGYGITIGTVLYGVMDKNATSATTCENPMSHYYFFIAVPIFTMCLIVINQAKWKQAPVMMVIAFAGYVVNYFSSQRFAGNTQVSNTLGALAIGVMANLYSRLGQHSWNWWLDVWEDKLRPAVRPLRRALRSRAKAAQARLVAAESGKAGPNGGGELDADAESVFVKHTRKVGYGLAAAAMLPAIFVQVPSGLAVSGSLVSGIASADEITGNSTNGTTVVNATTIASGDGINSVAFNVGYSVIQVAIGITVGLFLSALLVYPFGKRRSGLFSF